MPPNLAFDWDWDLFPNPVSDQPDDVPPVSDGEETEDEQNVEEESEAKNDDFGIIWEEYDLQHELHEDEWISYGRKVNVQVRLWVYDTIEALDTAMREIIAQIEQTRGPPSPEIHEIRNTARESVLARYAEVMNASGIDDSSPGASSEDSTAAQSSSAPEQPRPASKRARADSPEHPPNKRQRTERSESDSDSD